MTGAKDSGRALAGPLKDVMARCTQLNQAWLGYWQWQATESLKIFQALAFARDPKRAGELQAAFVRESAARMQALIKGQISAVREAPKAAETPKPAQRPAAQPPAPQPPAAKAEPTPKPAPEPAPEKVEAAAQAPAGGGPRGLPAADGPADDLKQINGIGPAAEKTLNSLGITRYHQVAAFGPEHVTWVDEHMRFKGRIERDDWVGQAKALAGQG
jgi:predicted flap endonuclease-1-like 5' DNA nuclease